MTFWRNTWLISKTIWIEAIRKKEIYVVVLVAVALIGGARMVTFFDVEGISKFYREVALKVMSVATSLTVILLTARQLPREFENRTIYPLLAKPVGRWNFLFGKFVGVLLAGTFCYGLFMIVFLIGLWTTGGRIPPLLFGQFVYLQLWSIAVVAALTYLLSMLFNTDAAISIASLLYLGSQLFLNLMSTIYDYLDVVQQKVVVALHFILPQLTLFDASGKLVHSVPVGPGAQVLWDSLAWWAVGQLTLYGFAYTALYLGLAYLLLKKKEV